MILSSRDIADRLPELVTPALPELINPASLDIRIGMELITEQSRHVNLSAQVYTLKPGEFVLVETLEVIKVPEDLVVELRLKSSIARMGYNHSLAFWFDPGWRGVGTMEIQNINQWRRLDLYEGMPFAQLIFHKLASVPLELYHGKYQNAQTVEAAKA